MEKVLIIHGFEAPPNGGWRVYLMGELKKREIYAFALSMPSPYEPKLNEWLEEINRYAERDKNDELYLIGHSLGGTALLRYFEKYNSENIKAAIFVSTPCGGGKDEKIEEFLREEFNWGLIKERVTDTIVVHGDNDPLVPLAEAEEIAEKLGSELVVIPNGQHLNGIAGFTEFPKMVELVTKLINKNNE